MTVTILTPPAAEPVSLAEVQAFLRLDPGQEEALLAGFIANAREICERFTGLRLIRQGLTLRQALAGDRRVLLRPGPVLAVDQIRLDGAILDPGQYAQIPGDGPMALRLSGFAPIGPMAVEIDYQAGFGDDWNQVPMALRQGILRLVAHQYRFRDDPHVAALPAAVAALWQPYREVRL